MNNLTNSLQKYFGHSCFRPQQQAIIQTILDGKDLLAVLPTGGGKSLCYQLPAMLLPGLTLVISPLVSLMKDQVDDLKSRGIQADWINSTLTPKQLREKLSDLANGQCKLLYVAPERLKSDDFLFLINTLSVNLIAVDEAHCVSTWGHDFRPSYKKLGKLLTELSDRPPIAGFTATATPSVKEDIVKLLYLDNPKIFQATFDRPNLYFQVEKPDDKKHWLMEYLPKLERSCIIYCATRKDVEVLADLLRSSGEDPLTYHAGLSKKLRNQAQEDFLERDDALLIATNAFGMGIDKQDVRSIIHYQMPADLESYYQEAGRAGRDGQKSCCILLFSPGDVSLQRQMIFSRPAYYGGNRVNRLAKLNAITNYVMSGSCLRQSILTYFSEDTSSCGNCQNCAARPPSRDATREAQILLSTLHYIKGKAPAGLIPAIVRGSKKKVILEKQLDTLSTYGLLKNYPERSLQLLLLDLQAKGFLEKTNKKFATTYITPLGVDLLKGERQYLTKIGGY
jgi:ATP-dependent DNA helicase RecQ